MPKSAPNPQKTPDSTPKYQPPYSPLNLHKNITKVQVLKLRKVHATQTVDWSYVVADWVRGWVTQVELTDLGDVDVDKGLDWLEGVEA